MTDVETSTLVKAIIAIIILVVIALVIYSVLNFDDIKQIAREVFHVDTQEEINIKTEDSVLAFSSELDACYDGAYNLNDKNNCFCFQKDHGYIQEDSYITIQNLESISKLTTFSENGEPLLQFTKAYNLGLMATSKSDDGYQLSCVFPPQFFLVGKDEKYDNNWYVKWIDDRLSFLSPLTEDYTFSFYSDKTSDQVAHPSLYRLDSTHYCLITTLVDEPVEYTFTEFIPLSITSTSKNEYFSLVQKFLLNEELYCNK